MSDSTERRIPVVSIVGRSDSGKTTVMEGLIREFSGRGLRVATVKHHIHEVDVDVPGKDSWRHAHAGAVTAMISSPTQFAVVRKVGSERTLDELVVAAGDADILLTEGFKRAGNVRIEVVRRARSDELTGDADELFAVMTDAPELVPQGVSTFALDDFERVTDLIVSTFLDREEG